MFGVKSKLDEHMKRCDGILRTNTNVGRSGIFTVINVGGVKKYQCAKCENVYENSVSVYPHFDTKHKEKKFKCEKCNKMFGVRSKMNWHVKTCNGFSRTKLGYEKNVIFDVINENGVKKYKCTKCENIYGNSWSSHLKKCAGTPKRSKEESKVKKGLHYEEIFENDGIKKYQCCLCEKIFRIVSSVIYHIHTIHREKEYQCSKCDKQFAIRIELKYHLKKCNGSLKLKSREIKNQAIKTPKINNCKFEISDLSYKVIESDLGKTYECYQCEAKFKKRAKFAKHLYRLHLEKTLKCERCDKLFAHSSLLNIHLKKCEVKSPQKYKTKENTTYKKIESEDKVEKIQCMICEEVFESVNTFHGHYSHTHREKRFRCDKCFKSFSRESDLNLHLDICREKTYKCDKCSKSFSFASNVWRHNKIAHENNGNAQMNKKHKCDTCGITFNDKLNLDKHLITHDYEIVILDDKIKQFQCKICKEDFKTKPILYQHIYKLHLHKSVKTYKCDICNKICTDTWKLRKHLKAHETKEKRYYEIFHDSNSKKYYRCKKCQVTSASLYTFKTHFKESHLQERNEGVKTIPSHGEVESNILQEVLENTTKKDHKIPQGSFDISTIKLNGTDVLAIANIREENYMIETDSNLKLESENMIDGELEKLYRVENNDTDPIATLNKEDMQIKTETEESILGF